MCNLLILLSHANSYGLKIGEKIPSLQLGNAIFQISPIWLAALMFTTVLTDIPVLHIPSFLNIKQLDKLLILKLSSTERNPGRI